MPDEKPLELLDMLRELHNLSRFRLSAHDTKVGLTSVRKKLLGSTQESVHEAGECCGFNDQNYFCKAFESSAAKHPPSSEKTGFFKPVPVRAPALFQVFRYDSNSHSR